MITSIEIEKYLQLSDILCLPSYREGFGSIIIQAAAVGLTSIGSNIYGIRDAILNGKTGLLHEPGNVEEIYNCMKKLLVNQELRNYLSNEAKSRVHNEFSQEIITNEWLKEYSFLLRK